MTAKKAPKAPKSKTPSRFPHKVIRFYLRMLPRRKRYFYYLSVATTVVGFLVGILATEISVLWFVSIACAVPSMVGLWLFCVSYRSVHIERSNTVANLCRRLTPSRNEEGYRTLSWSKNSAGSILISDTVNLHLMDNCENIALRENPNRANDIIASILKKQSPEFYRNVLLSRHRKSRQDGQAFANERKISLLTTPKEGLLELGVFRSSYFLSCITNDLVCSDVHDPSERHPNIWSAIENYPYDRVETRTIPLEYSRLSNHIGGNTIAISKDNCLVIPIQGPKVQRSKYRLAPSGSGSLDYSDFEDATSKNLHSLLKTGMERELVEECSEEGARTGSLSVSKTEVIGFYRWLSAGGLPGFLGVTKLGTMWSDIKPNRAEVEMYDEIPVQVPTLDHLGVAIERLLEDEDLSIPLYANLIALQNAITHRPQKLAFLFE